MTKRVLLSILTLLIVACLLLGVILAPGAFFAVQQALLPSTATPRATPTLVPIPSATPSVGVSPTPTASMLDAPSGQPTASVGLSLPPDVAAQMDVIEQQVIQIRGLAPAQSLKRNVLTKEQLRDKVVNDFFKDYTPEEAVGDSRVLNALGLLEPGFDLIRFYTDLYSEQVAGYYDSETKEMYVVEGESFGGPERLTYVHEFTHALQDQTYDLRQGLNLRDDYCQDHSQYCNAASSLIEGDASMTSYSWFFEFGTAQDQSQMQDFASTYSSPVYNSAPEFMKQDFLFPYQQGQEFTQSLYDLGGYSAIDRAFGDPPDSTEQILHPDQYPVDQPVDLPHPDLSAALGQGWKQIDSDVLGEWSTYLVLADGYQPETRLPQDVARTAAAGWQGDHYSAYWNESKQQMAFEQRWRWEKAQDMQEFWDALQTYAKSRWGSPQRRSGSLVWTDTADGFVTIQRSGSDITWVIAPDADAAGHMLEQLSAAQE